MESHEVDYEILGGDLQAVEVELDPGETVVAEAGAMNWMDDGISYTSKMGDGSEPDKGFFGKAFDAASRKFTGESIFMTHFTNEGDSKKRVAFAGPYPGRIQVIDLAKDSGILCQKDAFLCAAMGTKLSLAFNKKLGAGLFGGEGFILQKLEGDGLAFIHAGGALVKKELWDETLKIDTGCLAAFTSNLDYDIEKAGNLKSMLFGGEGLFFATLKGTGTVYLQTLPFSRLANRISKNVSSSGGSSKGEGSILGGFGKMFES